ncbi:MAG: GHKL domain-containing protein [Eubacterium sp.]|nr:GHKL domain-containing protein [Eubacterium sp.]
MNIIIILTIVTMFLHILGGAFASGRVFSKYKISTKELLLELCMIILVIIFAFFVNDNNKMMVISCGEVGAIWLGNIFIRKTDRRLGLFISIFYEFAIQLITLITGAVFVIITHKPQYMDFFNLPGIIVYLAGGLIIALATMVIYFLRDMSSRVLLRIAALLPIAACLFINYFTTIEIEGLEKEEMISWQYYAIFLLVAIMVFQMRKQYDMEKELAQTKSNEAMILEREYRSLSQTYENNAKLFHDFRNHCGVLKNFLIKGKNDEALSYLEELTGTGSTFKTEVWTGDETVDYLISSKKKLAEEKGISLEIEVEFPRNINIKSSDLCAILGNLLDNSIEACSKVNEAGRRKMRMVIRRIQQMIIIKIENTYEVMPVTKDGKYQTSKTDGGLHGLGIKSAETAAAKYDGVLKNSCTKDLFTTVVTLSFDAVHVDN